MKIILSAEQKNWLNRNLLKIASVQKGSTLKSKKRQITRLANKFESNAVYSDLNGSELKAIFKMANAAVEALTRAEAAYKEKGDEYSEYLEKIPPKKQMLEALADKVKRKLKWD